MEIYDSPDFSDKIKVRVACVGLIAAREAWKQLIFLVLVFSTFLTGPQGGRLTADDGRLKSQQHHLHRAPKAVSPPLCSSVRCWPRSLA